MAPQAISDKSGESVQDDDATNLTTDIDRESGMQGLSLLYQTNSSKSQLPSLGMQRSISDVVSSH